MDQLAISAAAKPPNPANLRSPLNSRTDNEERADSFCCMRSEEIQTNDNAQLRGHRKICMVTRAIAGWL